MNAAGEIDIRRALQHALSRGHGGKKIFSDARLKETLSDLLAEASRKLESHRHSVSRFQKSPSAVSQLPVRKLKTYKE